MGIRNLFRGRSEATDDNHSHGEDSRNPKDGVGAGRAAIGPDEGPGAAEPLRSHGHEQQGELESRSWFQRESDQPLTQHQFQSRLQMLSTCPHVFISDAAYRRICLIVELAPKEVGWMGTIDRRPDGNFYIDEIFVPEQEVTGSETDPSMDGLYKVMNDLVEMGEEGLQKIERLRFWGHSHVRMGTSPSMTDENTPMAFKEQGLPWFVRGIFNKLGRAEFTLYLFEAGYRIVDAPWSVVDSRTGRVLRVEKGFDWREPFDRQPSPRAFSDNVRGAEGPERTQAGDWAGRTAEARRPGTQKVVLPAELMPTDAERDAVRAELAAKLKERSFGTFAFGWRKRSEPGEETPLAPDHTGNGGAPEPGARVGERERGLSQPRQPGHSGQDHK